MVRLLRSGLWPSMNFAMEVGTILIASGDQVVVEQDHVMFKGRDTYIA